MNPLIYIVLSLKFFLPFLFFKFPFHASWLNFLLDTSDGDILIPLGMDNTTYQPWDKAADYVTYIMMLLVGHRWKIGKTIVALFIFRSIGQALYFVTGYDEFFFIFPNFLEPLFMIYALLLFKHKTEEKAFLNYKKHFWLIWTIIVIYKMWNEWNIHIARIDLSDLFF